MAEVEGPDLTVAPNFEALDGWIQKLSDWCHSAAEEIGDLRGNEARLEALEDETDKLREHVADLEFRADQFDTLAELIFDIDRGVRDTSEAVDWLKGRGLQT